MKTYVVCAIKGKAQLDVTVQDSFLNPYDSRVNFFEIGLNVQQTYALVKPLAIRCFGKENITFYEKKPDAPNFLITKPATGNGVTQFLLGLRGFSRKTLDTKLDS